MKVVRFLMFVLALTSISTLSYAQSEAQKSFDSLKTLAGSWQGPVTVMPATPEMKDGVINQVTLRVTSMGNALMHEMRSPDRPDDPITMMYLDNEKLMLTHYCDAGNRPRMTGKISPDGKKIEFEFLDVSGNLKYGHMHNAVFTLIDQDHHSEDWTFMVGEQPVHAHFDLQRTK